MRNADGVRNLRKIIDDEQNLFIIVSAMGKTTNALEKVFEGVQKGDKDLSLEHVAALREYHAGIIGDLWHGPKRLEKVDALFDELERVAVGTVYKPADAELWYDTIVAFGELVSTTIISEYLNYAGVANRWIDMRRCFLTEQRHKDAGVDLEVKETPICFGDAIEVLKQGGTVRRSGWNGKGLMVFKQVPAHIESDIIPKMQSLPQSAKDLILKGKGFIDYTSQCLIYNENTGRADSWVPSISDVFAEDWEIVE